MAAFGRIVVDDQNVSCHITYRRTATPPKPPDCPASTVNIVLARLMIAGCAFVDGKEQAEKVVAKSALQTKEKTDDLGDASRLGSLRSLRRNGFARGGARPRARRGDEPGVRGALQGKAQGDRGGAGWRRQACRDDRRIRGDRGSPRPARQLRRPRLCRRHLGPGAREVLRRPAGSADDDLDASPVLRTGAEPPRRRADREGARNAGARRLSPVDRGSAAGAALSARGSDRAALPREIGHRDAAPGTASSTRRSPASASTSRARRCRSSRRSIAWSIRTRRAARRPPRRLPRPSRRISGSSPTSPTCSPRTSRSPTNGAASRMWPRRGISQTASSRRSSTRWSPPCAPPIPACRTAITR